MGKESKTYEQRKQEILAPIFITSKETKKIKKVEVNNLRSDYLELKRKLKEANIRIKNADVIFGNLIRDFEIESNIIENSKEQEVLHNLWDFILSNTKRYFKIPLTKRELKKDKEDKITFHSKELRKLRRNRSKESSHKSSQEKNK